MFTVKQVAALSGITARALRHYDQVGLLKPTRVGANGYRYYDEAALLRLQQILFYRELDFPLEEIRRLLDSPTFDALSALQTHRERLAGRAQRSLRLMQTVDATILSLKGNRTMNHQELFSGFSEEQQEAYAAEAEHLYDPQTVRDSNARWKTYGKTRQQEILAEGGQILLEMAAAMPQGPHSAAAQQAVEHWRKHMTYFWTPTLEQLVTLAQMYNSDPRFKANYDAVDPNLAEFWLQAVKIYAAE